jgi:hypothetical protein
MGGWGDKIQAYQELKENNPNALEFRNPFVYWRQFFGDLGLDGLIIISLTSLIILVFVKRQGWLK